MSVAAVALGHEHPAEQRAQRVGFRVGLRAASRWKPLWRGFGAALHPEPRAAVADGRELMAASPCIGGAGALTGRPRRAPAAACDGCARRQKCAASEPSPAKRYAGTLFRNQKDSSHQRDMAISGGISAHVPRGAGRPTRG